MDIKVDNIIFNEDVGIEVGVSYWDETCIPHNAAIMTIFIPQSDYTLSELKRLALAEARKFLE